MFRYYSRQRYAEAIVNQLPKCPRCDAVKTLIAVRVEPHGVVVAECSRCQAVLRINADGRIVHDPQDVSGNQMSGDG